MNLLPKRWKTHITHKGMLYLSRRMHPYKVEIDGNVLAITPQTEGEKKDYHNLGIQIGQRLVPEGQASIKITLVWQESQRRYIFTLPSPSEAE